MADSLSMLLAGRALQAVGAGAGPVLSKAIAKETFSPDAQARPFRYFFRQRGGSAYCAAGWRRNPRPSELEPYIPRYGPV